VEITPDHVVVEGGGEREEIAADSVFLLTGYHPDTRLLEGLGVEVDPESLKPTHDPETFETNVPGVYLAGSIVSGRDTNLTFIETGRFHGAAVVKAIVSKK
jgi:thioredoxin reductase (NADPH)